MWSFRRLSILPNRRFFFRCNFVFRFCHAHQPMVEPANDVLQPLDSMPRLTGARKLMRFVRKTNHHRRNFSEFQGAKHLFATRSWRGSIIHLAENKHHRRLHVLYISDRRPRLKILLFIEWRSLEPPWLKQSKIG